MWRSKRNLGKGAAAGALAGLAGAGVMVGFAMLWHRAFPTWRRTSLFPSPEQDSDALVRGLRAVFGNLSQTQLARYAKIAHLCFGAGLGASYGLLAENLRGNRYPAALAFAGSEELLGNELLGWRFGITGPPSNYSRSERLHSLTSHLLWASVTESLRAPIRNRL